MPTYDTWEAKGVIAAIVKENGTTKQIKDPSDVDIVYGSPVTKFVFLEAATSLGQDASKTVNKTDIVGTQNQRITEGSIEESLTYDALAVEPAAIGDRTVIWTTGTVHGLTASSNNQYALTRVGFNRMFRSTNTYTVRLFYGCALDANGDADITTAVDIIDLEKCHISGNNASASGGGDVTVSVTFEPETASFPAAYNTAPN